MNIIYNSETDVLYIRLREGKIDESDEVKEGLIVDYDAEGKPIGIEVLDATELLGEKWEVAVELKKNKKTA